MREDTWLNILVVVLNGTIDGSNWKKAFSYIMCTGGTSDGSHEAAQTINLIIEMLVRLT